MLLFFVLLFVACCLLWGEGKFPQCSDVRNIKQRNIRSEWFKGKQKAFHKLDNVHINEISCKCNLTTQIHVWETVHVVPSDVRNFLNAFKLPCLFFYWHNTELNPVKPIWAYCSMSLCWMQYEWCLLCNHYSFQLREMLSHSLLTHHGYIRKGYYIWLGGGYFLLKKLLPEFPGNEAGQKYTLMSISQCG